ncbi:hypothetical protein MRX96_055702 [Rhipicephalus microplus]
MQPLLLQLEQTPTASPEDYGSEGFFTRDADKDDPEEEADGYHGDASLEMAIERKRHKFATSLRAMQRANADA